MHAAAVLLLSCCPVPRLVPNHPSRCECIAILRHAVEWPNDYKGVGAGDGVGDNLGGY
jgi:hypothetical protein